MKNRKGRTLVLAVSIIALFSFLAGLKIFTITSHANANAEPAETQQEHKEPSETIGQSAETRDINALLKKAEGYARQAEEEYKIAEGSWGAESKAYGSQPAIYFALKTISIQNEVIIKLLRKKVDM
ncbi:hypothetical protein HYT92_03195 [Candidatus Pacearchaeota archaeon]|nr:hypothetical protein [Candidatus Pacearchaeota archaeon]